jgi:hypothetical protein
MGQYIKVNGIRNLRRALERGQKNIRKEFDKAVWRTAQKAMKPIRKRVPIAFGELRNSIQAYPRGRHGNPVTSVDAPHAAAVEIGSRPHKPDFARLLAWVKLRGFQALNAKSNTLKKRISKTLGFTSAYQVPRIGKLIKKMEVRGKKGIGRHLPVDAAEQVAMAISRGIEQHGTKPFWFVRNSLPEIQTILKTEMEAAKTRIKG